MAGNDVRTWGHGWNWQSLNPIFSGILFYPDTYWTSKFIELCALKKPFGAPKTSITFPGWVSWKTWKPVRGGQGEKEPSLKPPTRGELFKKSRWVSREKPSRTTNCCFSHGSDEYLADLLLIHLILDIQWTMNVHPQKFIQSMDWFSREIWTVKPHMNFMGKSMVSSEKNPD